MYVDEDQGLRLPLEWPWLVYIVSQYQVGHNYVKNGKLGSIQYDKKSSV